MSEKRPWRRFSPDDFGPTPITVEVWSPKFPASVSFRSVVKSADGRVLVPPALGFSAVDVSETNWTHWRPMMSEPPEGL